MKAKSVLMGMLAGGAVAGIATLLAAPKSGYERGTLIANKDEFIGSIKDVKESAVELKAVVSTASKEGKAYIQTFITDVNTAIVEWKAQTKKNKKGLQENAKQLEDSIKELESELAFSSTKVKKTVLPFQ